MLGDKLRFRFAKSGTLRLLSHLDLVRCLERMLRRAGLPFKSTAGFHPGPRFVFALSLPLGVVGRDEVVEIEFTQPLESDDVLAKLAAQAPVGLAFTHVSVVPMKATAIPRRVMYELPLPAERVLAVEAAAVELMAQDKVWVDRLRPNPKRLNIRPYLRAVACHDSALTLDFWVTGTGTARADELLRLLGISDLLDAGAVLERTLVEIRDEFTNPDSADGPPDGLAESRPLDAAATAALTRQDDEANQPAAAHWGVSPVGPVVE